MNIFRASFMVLIFVLHLTGDLGSLSTLPPDRAPAGVQSLEADDPIEANLQTQPLKNLSHDNVCACS